MAVLDESTTETMTQRMSEVADTASTLAREAADSAGTAFRDADRTLRGSSDQALGMLGALSVGMAVGMILSGAPRILTLIALVPAVLVAGILLERTNREEQRLD